MGDELVSPLILHIPHASVDVPSEWRGSFPVTEEELQLELLQMTDRYTDELFAAAAAPGDAVVEFPVSRLLVDPERFVDDEEEIMSQRGMGVVYLRRHDGGQLRLDLRDKAELVRRYYNPHHEALRKAVSKHLRQHKQAVIIDCHSFPSRPLPYELVQEVERPHICIGTHHHHTPGWLEDTLVSTYEGFGYEVRVNTPFAGTIVPAHHFERERRVASAMIEIRRDLYMDEAAGTRNDGYNTMKRQTAAVMQAVRTEAADLAHRQLDNG